MRHPRTILLLVLLVLATACGARLTDEQRAFALQGPIADPGGSAAPSEDGGGPVELTTEADDAGASVANGEQVAAPPSGGDGSPGEGNGASGGPDGGGAGGQDAGGGEDGGGQTGSPTDTRAMPPGGNGGATDVGVSEDEIVLANISDISGAVPGLFEPEQLAAQAYVAYFQATEGTIYGRQLRYMPMDGQMSTGANRAASIDACERAFATVGSMSAFDAGAAPVIDECGIPDIRTAATETPMQRVDNAFPIEVTVPDAQPLGEYEWVSEQFPSAVKNAAYLYIAGEVTAAATAKVREATSRELGWEWTYVQEIDIAETDYGGFAREMANRDVEYVTFQGDGSQAARLAQAMRQQGFEPDIYHLQSNTYSPSVIERAPEAMEGTYVTISTVLVEEAADNEELQRYAHFLQQVAPGERPTSLGMKSWSAAKLFVELAKDIGPELTRAKMLEAIADVDAWDGGGLHAPTNVGGQEANSCYTIVQVQGGQFARVHPSQGLDCDGGVARM